MQGRFLCTILFLQLFSRFHPGLVREGVERSLSGDIKYFISSSLPFDISCFCSLIFFSFYLLSIPIIFLHYFVSDSKKVKGL